MGLQIYKPTKSNTGGAAHVSFSSKGDSKGVFVEFVKQNGWNQEARNGLGNGVFKGGQKVAVKLSTIEASALINAIERREDAPKMIHKSSSGTTTISFNLRNGKIKQGEKWVDSPVPTQFGFSASKGEVTAGISLTFAEAVELREYLKFALNHVFSGMYSDDVKKAKEYAAKKAEKTDSAPKSVKDFVKPEGESEPQVEVDDSDIPF